MTPKKNTGGPNEPARRPVRRSGRHPDAVRVEVRLTEPAVADLEALKKNNRNALRWALKKLILLERNPEAGRPLHKELQGWRKIAVGDRDWRIVWRVTFDDVGTVIVDVAEVWAIGARSDNEVYEEMAARMASLPDSPTTAALQEIASRLITPSAPTTTPTGRDIPPWLVKDLTTGVGLPIDLVNAMNFDEAIAALVEWRSRTALNE